MLTLSLLLLMTTPLTSLPKDAAQELQAWRAEKDREMQGQQSPLAYVGPRRLAPGHNVFGSGPDDGQHFDSPGLPARALDLYVQDVRTQLVPLLPLVALNGQPATASLLKPGDLVEVGPLQIRVMGNATVTIQDQSRPERVSYKGLHYLPVDGRYRVPATVEPPPPGKTLTLETTQHQQRVLPLKGIVHFELLGQPLSLEGFELGEHQGDLFVIFRDATSGHETYGAGRFLWVKAPVDGKTFIDFNQAWNPLCAYSDGYNCPLAPPENRLTIPIPVGEAPYRAH